MDSLRFAEHSWERGHCGLSVVVFLYVCILCTSVVASVMLLRNVASESGIEEVFILYSWTNLPSSSVYR